MVLFNVHAGESEALGRQRWELLLQLARNAVFRLSGDGTLRFAFLRRENLMTTVIIISFRELILITIASSLVYNCFKTLVDTRYTMISIPIIVYTTPLMLSHFLTVTFEIFVQAYYKYYKYLKKNR